MNRAGFRGQSRFSWIEPVFMDRAGLNRAGRAGLCGCLIGFVLACASYSWA